MLDLHKNRHTRYSKLASVTDLMRHEILFNHGGIWKDAGMNFFRPIFDSLLKYRFVVGSDMTIRHRWTQSMCFYLIHPKEPRLHRIINYPNVNKMRIYEDNALLIAGPVDFRQAVVGSEEYNP